jgi:hypothetical protein
MVTAGPSGMLKGGMLRGFRRGINRQRRRRERSTHMATTLLEVQAFLDQAELNYRVEQPQASIIVPFTGLTQYQCPVTGDPTLLVVIHVDEGGRFIKVLSPYAFSTEYAAFPDAALRACTELCYRTKGIQAEFDPEDGEVRMIVEFPLEDARLTAAQLHRCICTLTELVDEFAPVFDAAAASGDVDWSTFGEPNPSVDRMELADLVRAAGGVEGLRELVRSKH